MKKIGILIGRFQVPEPHEGHRFLINRILERCDDLIILVGSANRARSIKNPFTFMERSSAILNSFPDKEQRIWVVPLNDYLYNDSQWMADVAATIQYTVNQIPKMDNNVQLTLFGHYKEGNNYLKWFPQMKYENIDSDIELSGTEVRRMTLSKLPQCVQDDYAYFDKEAAKFVMYPYPETLNFNCGDAIVECLGHILLIERGAAPGAGTWALPGGHKNRNETFFDCAIRELYEETNLRVPEKVVRGSVLSTRLFDSPVRSNGIPRNTLAVHIRVQPDTDGTLPRARGADDAVKARWVSIEKALNEYRLFDDHADIISEMTGVKPLIAYQNLSLFK